MSPSTILLEHILWIMLKIIKLGVSIKGILVKRSKVERIPNIKEYRIGSNTHNVTIVDKNLNRLHIPIGFQLVDFITILLRLLN